MLLMEGKWPAATLKANLRDRVRSLAAYGLTPRLAAVLAGDDQASDLYLARKERLGRQLGMAVEAHRLPNPSERELMELLHWLSQRPDVDGILLEQPLPPQIRKEVVLQAIDPFKDVDGTTAAGGSRLGSALSLVPATPLAVMRLLEHYQIPLRGKHVVIVGHSPVVGRPLALLMLQEDATVTVCHKATQDLAAHTRQADLLVVAAGVPGLIRAEMVRGGAVVVDVGINLVNGETVGDVAFAEVSQVAGAITPVPGGVGPLTTLTILEKTLLAAERRAQQLTQQAAD